MRSLVVSDVHSNLEAFQSVIGDAESNGGFDEIWSLGTLSGTDPTLRPVSTCSEAIGTEESPATTILRR